VHCHDFLERLHASFSKYGLAYQSASDSNDLWRTIALFSAFQSTFFGVGIWLLLVGTVDAQPLCSYRTELAPFVVRAAAFLVAGYPHRAKHEIEQAITQDSTCGTLWLILAKSYRDMGELARSVSAATRAVELDSTLTDADELLAELYAVTNPILASEHASRAVTHNPSLSNRLRAAYLLRATDTAQAIVLLRNILREATIEEIADDLITLCIEYRDTTQAIALLRWSLFEYPDRPELARLLWLLYAQRQQWDSAWIFLRYAIYHMERVVVSASMSEWLSKIAHNAVPTPVILQTAGFLRERHDVPVSYGVFVVQLLFERSVTDAALALAEVLLMRRDCGKNEAFALVDALGQYGFAERASRLLIQRDSVWRDQWIPIARVYLLRTYGESQGVPYLQLLSEALARDSTDPAALFYAAHAADSLGNRSRALMLYERLLFYDPFNAAAANNLAFILAERGERLVIALELAQRALDTDSSNASFLDTYGWVLHKLGRYEEASKYLERAVEASPHPSATLFEHLGDNYYSLGVASKAHYWWRRALEVDPSRIYLRSRLP
jgi:Tfp pilus assembly protein PilF